MQFLFFLIAVISVPIVIFLPARKIIDWVIGLFLLFATSFYYSMVIIQFLQDNQLSLAWIVIFFSSYRGFVLDHWPQFNGFLQADYNFSSTFLPLLILGVSGLVRFIIVRFIPNNKLREFTHEHWLYISSFLIVLLIISNVCDWNFLITLLTFFVILIVIAAGLQRIFIDPFILIFGIISHMGKGSLTLVRRIWAYMAYIAPIAVNLANFFNKMFKNIRLLYDTYVREPFIRLNNYLNIIWAKENIKTDEQTQRITRILATQTLNEPDKNKKDNSDSEVFFLDYCLAYNRCYELYEAKKLKNKAVSTEQYENALSTLAMMLTKFFTMKMRRNKDINDALKKYEEEKSLDRFMTLAGAVHAFAFEHIETN